MDCDKCKLGLEEDLIELQAKHETMGQMRRDQDAEIDRLKATDAESHIACVEYEGQIERLKAENVKLDESNKALNARRLESLGRADKLQARVEELDVSNKDLNSRRLEQLGRADRLEARLAESQALLTDTLVGLKMAQGCDIAHVDLVVEALEAHEAVKARRPE